MPKTDRALTACLLGALWFSIAAFAAVSRHIATDSYFSRVDDMTTPREYHTATLLPNGKVLIVGGFSGTQTLNTAELYDPASQTFTATLGAMHVARYRHTATLLQNGKVLIAGGRNDTSTYVASAELYDPASETFTLTSGNLNTERENHSATLLANGNVLIAGGYGPVTGGFGGVEPGYLSSAELFDPGSGTFTATGPMSIARASHSATLLQNGKVLVIGGYNNHLYPSPFVARGEVYDPVARTFSPTTGSLVAAREWPAAALLPNGKVLIAGGDCGSDVPLATLAELYDPASGTFSATGNDWNQSIRGPSATLLPNGLVVVAAFSWSTGKLYDPEHGTFGSAVTLVNPRGWHTATLLPDGKVLFAGGTYFNGTWSITASAELFDSADPSQPTIASVVPNRGSTAGGQTVTITGTNLLHVTVTFGGVPATVSQTTNAEAVVVTPAHSAGAVDVTVTAPSALSATASAAYSYVANLPTNVTATWTPQFGFVGVTWTPVAGATMYQVYRSSDGINYNLVITMGGTSLQDLGVAANTAYLYAVRVSAPFVSENSVPDLATTVTFNDDPLTVGLTPIRAVHLTQLRTAVAAVRTLAGLSVPAWTDPTITPGQTVIKAAHIAELRSALDAARSKLLLPPVAYSQPISYGTLIRASDNNDLRTGMK